MKTLALQILTLAYSLGGIVTFLGFIPTMRDLYRGHPSANTITYLVWTTTTLLTFLYGIFILKDRVFNTVIGLQLLACAIILVLRLRLRK